ncbi:hypothetical protein O3G_MSEX007227 [Manduca sexta]|uniref:NADP-dependent oxidoreductase domain-containing protein n=1 Tax=Manduca sexta TaxID=7130 RepID=A0A922CMC6_MANSE|nr:hypothetical protein O3G_MSEX007227 [Manduca sexta]
MIFQMCSCVKVPTILLNNGRHMPAIALGTYLGFGESGVVMSKDNEFRDVVLNAVDIGYRHFDTASIYSTERELGEAVRMKIADGQYKREDFFITTKLWNTHHKREQVASALRESLDRLALNYVDLYLMHWPMGLNVDHTYSEVDFMETWRGLEDVYKLGLTKAIGVSNFNLKQLKRVLEEGTVKPAAIQIEIHPLNVQKELVEYAQAQSLVVMGYSPFGSLVARHGQWSAGPRVNDTTLASIAEKYGKTVPQVVLRWEVERNIVPLPKTVKRKRLEENINIFDFKLEKEEVDKISDFDSGTRYTLPSFWQNHPYYPFEKVDNPIPDPFLSA